MTDVFTALADPTRRSILERLRTADALSVSDLAEPLEMTRQAVTKHLDHLEAAGLVQRERDGRERRHRLIVDPLRDIDDWLAPYAAQWDRRLARLRAHLERPTTTSPKPEPEQ